MRFVLPAITRIHILQSDFSSWRNDKLFGVVMIGHRAAPSSSSYCARRIHLAPAEQTVMRVQGLLQLTQETNPSGSTRFDSAVQGKLCQVQRDHPEKAIDPHPADNSPWKRGHHDTQPTHEYGGNLSRDDGEK